MPHVEIRYSDNLDINTHKLFDDIEATINKSDATLGECKSRAYPCSQYKYPHVLVTATLLDKPWRDQAFTQKLSEETGIFVKKNNLSKALAFHLK